LSSICKIKSKQDIFHVQSKTFPLQPKRARPKKPKTQNQKKKKKNMKNQNPKPKKSQEGRVSVAK